jgi:hypothetical protein
VKRLADSSKVARRMKGSLGKSDSTTVAPV